LPNVGPYIYEVSISGFTRSSIYIYDISSLRVKYHMNIHCGYAKDLFFVPSVPHMLDLMMNIIVAALPTMECDMLESVWGELDWRTDVCRVTPGAHI